MIDINHPVIIIVSLICSLYYISQVLTIPYLPPNFRTICDHFVRDIVYDNLLIDESQHNSILDN
jgi:hypothetical protein